MKVKVFVSISSLALFVWLTGTFIRVVPMDTYNAPLATVEVDRGEASEVVVAKRDADELRVP
jgi:hypothetical protein